MRDILFGPRSAGFGVVPRFVIDPQACGRAGGAEVVDRYPGQDLVGRPGVVVGPVVEFLVDPGQQRDGAVVEGVAQCLGFRALFPPIP